MRLDKKLFIHLIIQDSIKEMTSFKYRPFSKNICTTIESWQNAVIGVKALYAACQRYINTLKRVYFSILFLLKGDLTFCRKNDKKQEGMVSCRVDGVVVCVMVHSVLVSISYNYVSAYLTT